MEELLDSCLGCIILYGMILGAALVGIIWLLVWLFS